MSVHASDPDADLPIAVQVLAHEDNEGHGFITCLTGEW